MKLLRDTFNQLGTIRHSAAHAEQLGSVVGLTLIQHTRDEIERFLLVHDHQGRDAKQPLRVAIVGSRPQYAQADPNNRHLYDQATMKRHEAVRAYVQTLPKGTVIVTGAWWDHNVLAPTNGVDRVAAEYARDAGLTVCLVAGSPTNGRAAGVIRNPVVVDIAQKVKAFMDTPTPGTTRTMRIAHKAGKLIGDPPPTREDKARDGGA